MPDTMGVPPFKGSADVPVVGEASFEEEQADKRRNVSGNAAMPGTNGNLGSFIWVSFLARHRWAWEPERAPLATSMRPEMSKSRASTVACDGRRSVHPTAANVPRKPQT
jgi:hypothetical protein